jgi:hypothetical protein
MVDKPYNLWKRFLKFLAIFRDILEVYLPKHQMMRWRVNKLERLTYLSATRGSFNNQSYCKWARKF